LEKSEAIKLPVDFVYNVGFFDKYLLFATPSGLFSLDISYLNQVEQLEGSGLDITFKKIITRSLIKVLGFK
jgi:hypothetical protein